ncbi:MAG: translation elongation factor Ts [Verrucomicrobiota bacterium]|nr:translation elongation factor Ts [Verrucomicrobiota bacterium]
MAKISAKMVKELRDKTGAGMMDCKKALVASDGDHELAIDNLRKSGIAKAEKKAERTVKEGCVSISINENTAVALELLCETDFVAKNEQFIALNDSLSTSLMDDFSEEGDLTDALNEKKKNQLTEVIAKLGENIQLRRALRWNSESGTFTSYSHMGGKIGILLETEGDAEEGILDDLAMHIAAFNPDFISSDEISEEKIAKEREIAAAQVEGKPKNIIGKIVEGKIKKWFTQVCLVKQPWIKDDKSSLEKIAPNLKVKRFIRWEMGGSL